MESLPTAAHGAENGGKGKGMAAENGGKGKGTAAENGGKGTTTTPKAAPAHADGDFTPTRALETDILAFDLYLKSGFTLADVEAQVRLIRLPHVTWCENFVALEDSPAPPAKRLRVSALLTGSDDSTVARIEAALTNLILGNHGAVSSASFRGFSKSF